MSMPIVLGAPPSGAVARWFGIRQGIELCKREGATIADHAANIDTLGNATISLLEDAMFDIVAFKEEASQGTLWG